MRLCRFRNVQVQRGTQRRDSGSNRDYTYVADLIWGVLRLSGCVTCTPPAPQPTAPPKHELGLNLHHFSETLLLS